MKNLMILMISVVAMMAIGCSFSDLFPLPGTEQEEAGPVSGPEEDQDREELLEVKPAEGDIEAYFPQGFDGISYADGVYTLYVNNEVHEYKDGDVDYFGPRNAIKMEINSAVVTFSRAGYDPLIFRF